MVNKQQNKSSGKSFTITKRIAKHGSQSIIVIPRILEAHLKPGTITQITINVIEPIENLIESEVNGLDIEGGKDGN